MKTDRKPNEQLFSQIRFKAVYSSEVLDATIEEGRLFHCFSPLEESILQSITIGHVSCAQ